VRICDDTGAVLPAGQEGEIVVRRVTNGPWAGKYRPMLGYWVAERVDPFEGEELRTGDIGVVDNTGSLFVRDRKKLLIIRGGANVYPREVERVLESAPGVRGSAVLGVPDPRLGQRVVAVVEVEAETFAGVDDLEAHCRTSLARYKVPEQILVVDALPRNAMGKAQRAHLVELFVRDGAPM
jgi:long-chain acyl-CoA synthetase